MLYGFTGVPPRVAPERGKLLSDEEEPNGIKDGLRPTVLGGSRTTRGPVFGCGHPIRSPLPEGEKGVAFSPRIGPLDDQGTGNSTQDPDCTRWCADR